MSPTGPSAVEDLFYAKTASFAFHRKRLEFDLAHTVFASAGVDPGSALLLRHLQALPLAGDERVLDIGCGHGTLGIVLAALDSERDVTFVDRDALALRFTERNLAGNDLTGTVAGSLGYDDLDPAPRFGLIVSNIAGKAGEAVIGHLVCDAARVATEGAVAAFVIVAPLAELLRGLVADAGYEVLTDTGTKSYHVVIARIAAPAPTGDRAKSGFERGLYDRANPSLRAGGLAWSARTVVGIDEFDSLSIATRLLPAALRGLPAGPAIVVEPGQGHRAVIGAELGQRPAVIVSRDLLALRATERLLAANGVAAPTQAHHRVSATAEPAIPTLIVHAEDKVPAPWLYQQVDGFLAMPGKGQRQLVVTGRASVLGRLEAELLARRPGRVAHKGSERGHRALRFSSNH